MDTQVLNPEPDLEVHALFLIKIARDCCYYTIVYWGFIGIMEKIMGTTIVGTSEVGFPIISGSSSPSSESPVNLHADPTSCYSETVRAAAFPWGAEFR